MSETFKAIIVGDDEVRRRLYALAEFGRRPALAMRRIAQALETITDENFEAQGRPKWKKLADSTVAQRLGGGKAYYTNKKGEKVMRKAAQRAQGSMRILQVTGKLAGSVHGDSGDDWASVGEWGPYARIHQLGGEAGRGHKVTIPARPSLPFANGQLQPEAEREVLQIALEALEEEAQ